MGIEPKNSSSGSDNVVVRVRFGSVNLIVRFGFGTPDDFSFSDLGSFSSFAPDYTYWLVKKISMSMPLPSISVIKSKS